MAWSTPLTAVANAVLTAAQWNASVRDNLLETVPAKATAASQIPVSTGANAMAMRTPAADFVSATETTTSTSFVALATAGPAVTVTCGTRAIVFLFSWVRNNTVNGTAIAGYAVTGASAVGAGDNQALELMSAVSNQSARMTAVFYQQALTSGSNTFTMQYRVNAGTGTFADRRIFVIPQ